LRLPNQQVSNAPAAKTKPVSKSTSMKPAERTLWATRSSIREAVNSSNAPHAMNRRHKGNETQPNATVEERREPRREQENHGTRNSQFKHSRKS
jgi:hypothetical protein